MTILQTRVRAIAAGTVVAASAAAPAAIWYVNEVRPEPAILEHVAALPAAIQVPEAPAEEPESTRTVVVDEVVIVEPRPRPVLRPAVRTARRASHKKRCTWHQSIALSSGKVRICDVERPTTGQGAQLLAPLAKRDSLGQSLDVPSPTGLIESAQRGLRAPSSSAIPTRGRHALVGQRP